MVSHPNIDLVHRFFQAYATNDFLDIEKILSPAIQWHIPGNHPLSGIKSGVDEVLNYFKQLGKANFQASPIVIGANEEYVIDCHQNWSLVEGIENLTSMSCLLWKIKNGQIIEVHNFPENQHKVDSFFQVVYSQTS
jgi:ketosteroid isomerase-like protein